MLNISVSLIPIPQKIKIIQIKGIYQFGILRLYICSTLLTRLNIIIPTNPDHKNAQYDLVDDD
ncbi:MAG: hypothetical protein WAR77_05690 [Saprospiraceae bacterium]|nr:hypothetical protein [Saprospiraceae bacterium]